MMIETRKIVVFGDEDRHIIQMALEKIKLLNSTSRNEEDKILIAHNDYHLLQFLQLSLNALVDENLADLLDENVLNNSTKEDN